MNRYKISKGGIAFIKNEESCRLKTYRDQVGVPTVGYGHTGPDVVMGKTITFSEAERLLLSDLERCEKSIQGHVSRVLTQNQVDASLSFCFNVGVGGFEGSTLLKMINANPNDPKIRDQFMRWVHGTVGGKKVQLPVLKARRKREADLYFS